MRKWFSIKAKKRASLNARRRANRRWEMDRQRRTALALKDPIQVGGRIVRRIVVIDNESQVKERTFYQFDRPCDWKRKEREVLV
jgi:hypothetical protein